MQDKRTLMVPYRLVQAAAFLVQKSRLLDFSMAPGVLRFFRYPWIASGEKAKRELGFEAKFSSRESFATLLERKGEVVRNFNSRIRARGFGAVSIGDEDFLERNRGAHRDLVRRNRHDQRALCDRMRRGRAGPQTKAEWENPASQGPANDGHEMNCAVG